MDGMGEMDGMGGMGGMMMWMLLWGFVGIALIVLLVVGTVWLVRRSEGGGDRRLPAESTGPQSAEEILRRRYAAGEIDEDEFLRRRAGLE